MSSVLNSLENFPPIENFRNKPITSSFFLKKSRLFTRELLFEMYWPSHRALKSILKCRLVKDSCIK